MRIPRLQIAWVMILIAIAALNLGAFRALLADGSPLSGVLALGWLPMANILAIGLLVGYQSPESRSFLLGFEVCGAAALVVYGAVMVSGIQSIWIYFAPIFYMFRATIGPHSSTSHLRVTYYLVSAVWAAGPQLVLALIGGSLTRYNAASRISSSSHQSPDPHNP